MSEPMCVPPEQVDLCWHVVRPMIDAAYAEADEIMPAELQDHLREGKLLLWVSVDDGEITGTLITALLRQRSGLACKLVACGGRGGEWTSRCARIEAYARDEGCGKVFAEGRVGWPRVLPGYKTKRVVMEKRLD